MSCHQTLVFACQIESSYLLKYGSPFQSVPVTFSAIGECGPHVGLAPVPPVPPLALSGVCDFTTRGMLCEQSGMTEETRALPTGMMFGSPSDWIETQIPVV